MRSLFAARPHAFACRALGGAGDRQRLYRHRRGQDLLDIRRRRGRRGRLVEQGLRRLSRLSGGRPLRRPARSVFYGFPPDGDLAPAWESFSGFNRTGPRIEWRVERHDGRETPFATIHRWFVADGEGGSEIEVLVVEKVGQIHGREGCVVGYVVASGNPDANGKARRIADGQARDFSCGDQPAIDAGSVPLPEFVHDRP